MVIKGGPRKYSEISFLRSLAITTVVLMHLIQVYWNGGDIPMWLRHAASLGGTGGHVFIFCSGFGLYLSYLKKPCSVSQFLKSRFVKIYIPYLIFLLIHFVLPHSPDPNGLRIRMLLSHVFLYKMFFEDYMCSFGLQLWFISTIIQLYILFIPLCRLRSRTSLKSFVLISAAVSIVWWILMYVTGLETQRIWGSCCFQYIWEFALGMASAEYLFGKDMIVIPAPVLVAGAVGGLGLQGIMALAGGIAAAFNDFPGLIGYISAALLLYRLLPSALRSKFQNIDHVSYEWYLVHVDAIMWGYYFGKQITENEFSCAVGAFTFSLCAAWAFSLLVRAVMKIPVLHKAGD